MTLTHDEVVARLKNEHQQHGGTARGLARHIGVTPQYLSAIYSGRIPVGPAVLKHLDLERLDSTVYRTKEK